MELTTEELHLIHGAITARMDLLTQRRVNIEIAGGSVVRIVGELADLSTLKNRVVAAAVAELKPA